MFSLCPHHGMSTATAEQAGSSEISAVASSPTLAAQPQTNETWAWIDPKVSLPFVFVSMSRDVSNGHRLLSLSGGQILINCVFIHSATGRISANPFVLD